MLTYRDFKTAFSELDLGLHSRLIVHASLQAFEPVAGGTNSIVGALLSTVEMVLTPTFTTRTMVTPAVGPPDNAINYGDALGLNNDAMFFTPDLPADPDMGDVAEIIRCHPDARRSSHPILSFAGLNVDEALESQSIEDPFAPISWLADFDGDVLLVGVDHTANVSLHYSEKAAGRVQFTRWALTPEGVVACPGFPGCPDGFQAIAPRLEAVVRRVQVGHGTIEAIPLRDLVNIAVGWIHEDPRAMLCDRLGCPRCSTTRALVRLDS
jgi:aminoglycoside 3-N-acetyltransferase